MPEARTPRSPFARSFRRASDPEIARHIIGLHLCRGREVRCAKIVKAWPKPGSVFVFLYEVMDESGESWATLYLFPEGSSRMRPSCPSRASYVPELNAYVQLFPNDYRMRHLRLAAVPFKARGIIAAALDSSETGWGGFCLRSVHPLSYWPSRKCLLRYKGSLRDNAAAHFYVKLFFEDTALSLLDLHRELRSAGFDGRAGLEVPAPIGYCREFRAALMAPAKGKMVFGLLDSPGAARLMTEAGRLLCNFHKYSSALTLPVYGPEDEIRVLQGWASSVELTEVREMSKVRSLLGRLTGKMGRARRPFYPGHGDFYDKQILFDGNIMTILDLDTACLAPAERDTGNFLAHLELRGLEKSGRADHYVQLGQPFMDAYENSSGVVSARSLFWYRASAFLRLACRAAIQPGEAGQFEPLVSLAERDIDLV